MYLFLIFPYFWRHLLFFFKILTPARICRVSGLFPVAPPSDLRSFTRNPSSHSVKPVLNAVITLFQFLVFLAILLMETVVRLLPLQVCELLGTVLGTVGSRFAPKYRILVRRNLRIAFEGEKSPDEINALANVHFSSLGRNFWSA